MQIATLKYETISPSCGITSPIYRIAPHIYKVASPICKIVSRIYKVSSLICKIDTPLYKVTTPINKTSSPKFGIMTLFYKVGSRIYQTATQTEETTECMTETRHTNYQQDNILNEMDCT